MANAWVWPGVSHDPLEAHHTLTFARNLSSRTFSFSCTLASISSLLPLVTCVVNWHGRGTCLSWKCQQLWLWERLLPGAHPRRRGTMNCGLELLDLLFKPGDLRVICP